MYNDEAKKVAIKAIGAVESSMKYDSINYNDPITVGLVQWYGTRASAILRRMKTENPSSWVGVQTSFTESLDNNSDSNSRYWTTRWLTKAEGESLKPVLLANKAIQDNQIIVDFEDYVVIAEKLGIDKDNNTQTMLLFFTAYHQSPKRAMAVVNSIGGDSSLERLRAALLNEERLGDFPNRINTAYKIIKEMDSTGIDDPPTPSEPPAEGGNPTAPTRPDQPMSKLMPWGESNIIAEFKDGHRILFNSTGTGFFTTGQDETVGAPNVPSPDPEAPDPDPIDPSDPPTGKGDEMVRWMKARIGKYAYTQGAGRLTPDKYNATDCSGLVRYCLQKVIGKTIGTYTGAQYTQGRRVDSGSSSSGYNTSKWQPGDLIYLDWIGRGRSTVDHVEMYIGGNQTIGHGGPGQGPTIKQLSWLSPNNYYIQRHIADA